MCSALGKLRGVSLEKEVNPLDKRGFNFAAFIRTKYEYRLIRFES